MAYWTRVRSGVLAQGDFLPQCGVPVVSAGFDEGLEEEPGNVDGRIRVDVTDLIVVTQSCDLENRKAPWVACCPIHTLSEFEHTNPTFVTKWEMVRQGRIEGVHLLAGLEAPEDNRQALVVNFRQVFSLPIEYLQRRSEQLGDRWRLQSPYLEHFSQAFARFFMRVGLPSPIPPY